MNPLLLLEGAEKPKTPFISFSRMEVALVPRAKVSFLSWTDQELSLWPPGLSCWTLPMSSWKEGVTLDVGTM